MYIIQCVNKEYIDPFLVSRQSQIDSGVQFEHLLFSYDDLNIPHIKLPEPNFTNNTPFSDTEFKGMVLRLSAFDWLKENGYNRVLYLDSDTVINDSLAELESFELNGNWLGAVPENSCKYFDESAYEEMYPTEEARRRELNAQYFNSGVLLVDLQAFDGSFIENFEPSGYIYPDQDYLNSLAEQYIRLPRKYNEMPEMRITEMLNTEQLVGVRKDVMNAAIAHYAGVLKPYIQLEIYPYGLQMLIDDYFEIAKRSGVSARFLLTIRNNMKLYKSTIDTIEPFL